MDTVKRRRCLNFPTDRTIGILYERSVGKKRWQKHSEAQGLVPLAENKEYRLKLYKPVRGAKYVAATLAGLDCNQLHEIEMNFEVFREDINDQILHGDWLDQFLEEQENEILAVLRTKADIIFKTLDLSGRTYGISKRNYVYEKLLVPPGCDKNFGRDNKIFTRALALEAHLRIKNVSLEKLLEEVESKERKSIPCRL